MENDKLKSKYIKAADFDAISAQVETKKRLQAELKELNTYGVAWNDTEYIFYINGKETGRSSFGGTSEVPEYLLLTVEAGGANSEAGTSWAGDAINTDAIPSDFVIDYVRAYQYKALLDENTY